MRDYSKIPERTFLDFWVIISDKILDSLSITQFLNDPLILIEIWQKNLTKIWFSSKPKFEKIETLIICQYKDGTDFDLSSLKYFTRLKDLIIEESTFNHFTHKFPKLDHLKVTKFHLKCAAKTNFPFSTSTFQKLNWRSLRVTFSWIYRHYKSSI